MNLLDNNQVSFISIDENDNLNGMNMIKTSKGYKIEEIDERYFRHFLKYHNIILYLKKGMILQLFSDIKSNMYVDLGVFITEGKNFDTRCFEVVYDAKGKNLEDALNNLNYKLKLEHEQNKKREKTKILRRAYQRPGSVAYQYKIN